MNKVIVFDMDGTIADFYSVPGWKKSLNQEDESPYREAQPMCDMESLAIILKVLKKFGWRIAITSWLAGDSTRDYDKKVRKAKKEWLDRYKFPYDEVHLVKYGTTKADCTRKLGGRQVLIDDNEKVLKGWTLGEAIDAKKGVLNAVVDILIKELMEVY